MWRWMRGITLCTLILLSTLTSWGSDCPNSQSCDEVEYGLSATEIQAIEHIEISQLPVASNLLRDRWYYRLNGAVNVYDAPDGTVIRSVPAGFNFVTILGRENGWTRININEWVRNEDLTDASSIVSSFTGILLPEEMPSYTLAWALVNMYPSATPGGEPDGELPFIHRYTLLNLYATEVVDGQRWYQIAPNQWVHQFRVAKVIPIETPETVTTDIWIGIDLYEQTIIAYEGDTPIFATLVATGLPRWPTYEGTFNVYFRRAREDMSWGTPGDDFYVLEEVPWTMFFDHGRALHGAYWHDGFGYRRSHGCVNMSITDAKWMYDWVAAFMGSTSSRDKEEGPNVYVYSSGVYNE